MSFGPHPDLGALAAAIADDLCIKKPAAVSGSPQEVARAVEAAIRDNLRLEEEVKREAERALAQLGSSAAGMDKNKLLHGIRDRIAKQKGFVP